MEESLNGFSEYMSGLKFENNYNDFMEVVDCKRKKMLQADSSLILGEGADIEEDIYSIDRIPTGRFRVKHRGVCLECFAYVKSFTNEQTNKLWIMFSGARHNQYPLFVRWSYYTFLKGSVLCIDDPMIGEYMDLLLGWYYGNHDVDYRQVIAEFVEVVAKILKVNNENIVFMGSSAGGAPVFECASYIYGSCAVAINPQIKLEQYDYATDFCRITGNRLQNDKWYRNDTVYYIKGNSDQKKILITNLRSKEDMRQLGNICDELQIKVNYGFNFLKKYNLIIWIYDADARPYLDPHSTVEYNCIAVVIDWLTDNEQIPCEDFPSFQVINEFWHEQYLMQKKYLARTDQIKKIESVLHTIYKTNRCVVVFGCGGWDDFLTAVLDIQSDNHFMIQYAIDNDVHKCGTDFRGLIVRHPSEITDWSKLFIIITAKRHDADIQKQLETLGLEHKKDFIKYEDLILN